MERPPCGGQCGAPTYFAAATVSESRRCFKLAAVSTPFSLLLVPVLLLVLVVLLLVLVLVQVLEPVPMLAVVLMAEMLVFVDFTPVSAAFSLPPPSFTVETSVYSSLSGVSSSRTLPLQ